MKVRLLTGRASIDEVNKPGDVIEVSEAEAKRMIEAGTAVAVKKAKPEAAMKPAAKPR